MSKKNAWLVLTILLSLVWLGACTESAPEPGGSAGGVGGTAGSAGFAGSGVSGGTGGQGVGGGAGQGGSAGQGGTGAGTGGVSGGSGGMAGDSGGSGGEGDFVSDVNVVVHDDVKTILVVTWKQLSASDTTWLEFSFEDGNVMRSRPKAGALGDHKDVVLGVPGETDVTLRIVNSVGGADHKTIDYHGTTGAVPAGMPRPEVLAYDASIASPDRWMFGAVEDSQILGSADRPGYYAETFWIYIIDRKGRIVWYFADPSGNAISSFQRIARDGEYIWIESPGHHTTGGEFVTKMTLDHAYEEKVTLDFSDCIDVTADGSLLFDMDNPDGRLRELNRAGEIRDIYSCPEHFGEDFACYSNTVNWNPADDTVLLSYPRETTVIQVSRQTGEVVGQYGTAPDSYAFEPATWEFEFQHFANITPEGTLLLSTHLPGNDNTTSPVAGQHAFAEFTIDRQNKKLIEKWLYSDGPEWAMYKGMAMRLPNGNTLGNYGTGGVIREITPDKKTAFHVKFDVPEGDDFFNKMVGNNVLLDDLYALNGGGPK